MNCHPDFEEAVRRGQRCPYCTELTVYTDSAEVYGGHSYGPIYLCRPCKAWVGVHHRGRKALGRVANAELREWKKKAHESFDQLWKRKVQQGIKKDRSRAKGRRYIILMRASRSAAYQWLSETMNIPKKHTHIGMFDIEQCMEVVQICKPYLKR